jgi:hypothetical protein
MTAPARSKEWWMRMAEREDGLPVTAGVPDAPARRRTKGVRREVRTEILWSSELFEVCAKAAADQGISFSLWLRLAAAEAAGVAPHPTDLADLEALQEKS